MSNQDIRNALVESGVKQWELADKAGLSASHFVTKLRHELSAEEKCKLFILIQEIVDEREQTKEERKSALNKKTKDELIEMIMNR